MTSIDGVERAFKGVIKLGAKIIIDSLENKMNKRFEDMTLQELELEYHYWDDRIAAANSWGGALAVAAEFRRDCARHIKLRKQSQITNIMEAG